MEPNPRYAKIVMVSELIELDKEVVDDLCSDQYYGYRMVKAIRSGVVLLDLQLLEIGPVYHARWLTTANRFLKLWVSKHNFKGTYLAELKLIVGFIVGIYYPM